MIRILPIGSSSSGNSMLILINGSCILIDVGMSCRSISNVLKVNGLSIQNIDAVLITHTHSDHVRGLNTLLKKYTGPIFMSDVTRANLLLTERADVLPYYCPVEILPGLSVTAFPTSHDCPGSAGFILETPVLRFGYATDLGVMTDSILSLLSGCIGVVIESNHDIAMLASGPYPAPLKKRILSDQGHLSNAACASAIDILVSQGTRHFLLAHLSEENNLPHLALQSAITALAGRSAFVTVLPPSGGEPIEIG